MSQKTKHRRYMRVWTARNPEKKATNDANSYRRHRESRLKKAAAYRRRNRKKIKLWQRAMCHHEISAIAYNERTR